MRNVTNYMEKKDLLKKIDEEGIEFDFIEEIKSNTITINDQFEVIGNTYKYKDVLKLIYNAKWNVANKVWELTKENTNLIYKMAVKLDKVVK